MATTINNTQCCALGEIKNLSDSLTPHDQLKAYMDYLKTMSPARRVIPNSACHMKPFILFTGVTKMNNVVCGHPKKSNDYGADFAAYLTANNLGKVTATSERKNFTSNMVRCWIWEPDYEALEKFWLSLHPLTVEVAAAEEIPF